MLTTEWKPFKIAFYTTYSLDRQKKKTNWIHHFIDRCPDRNNNMRNRNRERVILAWKALEMNGIEIMISSSKAILFDDVWFGLTIIKLSSMVLWN